MRLDQSAFYGSLFLSRLADQVLLFVVPLVVFETTRSAAWAGMAFFVETLPRFLAFPVCGVLCDRVAPLLLLRRSQSGRAAACTLGLALVLLLPAGAPGVVVLVLLSAVCGVLTTQGVIAREVMLPHVFAAQPMVRVLAQAQMADQLGMVLGPVLAAVWLAHSAWPWVLGGAAALFVLADGLLLVWRRHSSALLPEPAPVAGQSFWQALAQAALHVRHLPGLPALVTLAAGVNLVVGGTLATAAAMLIGVHMRSQGDYGWLQTAGAVATVPVLLGITRSLRSPALLGWLGFALILCGGLLTAASPSVWGYIVGYLLVVGFDKMFGVAIRAERQRIIPRQDYGKTSGLIVLLNNLTQPLAGLLVGALAHTLEAAGVVGILAICMGLLGVVVLALRLWRARRQ